MKNYFRILSWSVIVSLGGFLFGFDTAVISGVEKTIQAIFSLILRRAWIYYFFCANRDGYRGFRSQ